MMRESSQSYTKLSDSEDGSIKPRSCLPLRSCFAAFKRKRFRKKLRLNRDEMENMKRILDTKCRHLDSVHATLMQAIKLELKSQIGKPKEDIAMERMNIAERLVRTKKMMAQKKRLLEIIRVLDQGIEQIDYITTLDDVGDIITNHNEASSSLLNKMQREDVLKAIKELKTNTLLETSKDERPSFIAQEETEKATLELDEISNRIALLGAAAPPSSTPVIVEEDAHSNVITTKEKTQPLRVLSI